MFVVDEDIYIEHFGIKGMQWGVRKDPKNSIARKKEQLDRANAELYVLGSGLKGYAAQKLAKKTEKKIPGWNRKMYEKLSEPERRAYDQKITRRAYFNTVAIGAAQVGVILGGKKILASTLSINPKTMKVVNQGAYAMSVMIGINGAQEVRAIKTAGKVDRLRREINGK